MQQYVQLKAKEVSKEPIVLEPDKTLYTARNTMLAYGISRIVVVENNKPIGIITEKDMARILYTDTTERRIDEIKLDEVMTKSLITVNEDSGLNICAKLMNDRGISSVITIDNQNNLKGIVTKSDLVDVYGKYYRGKNLVEDYMIKKVFTVGPEESTRAVLSIMANNKISRVVVVRDKKPIGIITGRDLLPVSGFFGLATYGVTKMSSFSGKDPRLLTPSGIVSVFLARDIMTHDPIAVRRDSDLAFAALIMANNRISGLPVLDSDDNLSGIVTKTNIVRAFMSI